MHLQNISRDEIRTIELARQRTNDRLLGVVDIIKRLDEEVTRLRRRVSEKLPAPIHLPE